MYHVKIKDNNSVIKYQLSINRQRHWLIYNTQAIRRRKEVRTVCTYNKSIVLNEKESACIQERVLLPIIHLRNRHIVIDNRKACFVDFDPILSRYTYMVIIQNSSWHSYFSIKWWNAFYGQTMVATWQHDWNVNHQPLLKKT